MTHSKVVSPVIYRAITGLCSYLGLTLISMSITNGVLSIVVSGTFTLALVTNHNGMYLINTPCSARALSANMLEVITCILAHYGLMLISASISNGRLIVVCAKDASIPPPLANAYQRGNAQVAVVYVCEVFHVVSTHSKEQAFSCFSMKGVSCALVVPVIVTLPTSLVSTLPTSVVSMLTLVCLAKVVAPPLEVITRDTKQKVVPPVIYRAIAGLCSYLGLTLISMTIVDGVLSIVVSGKFTLALLR
jgi:hypothetical protein